MVGVTAPDGWTPKPGDLVVVVRVYPEGSTVTPLDGEVTVFVSHPVHTARALVRHHVTGNTWYVDEVRPLTPEETSAYWLDRGAR